MAEGFISGGYRTGLQTKKRFLGHCNRKRQSKSNWRTSNRLLSFDQQTNHKCNTPRVSLITYRVSSKLIAPPAGRTYLLKVAEQFGVHPHHAQQQLARQPQRHEKQGWLCVAAHKSVYNSNITLCICNFSNEGMQYR